MHFTATQNDSMGFIMAILFTATILPGREAKAEFETVRSSTEATTPGRMRVRVDEFGTFGSSGRGQAVFGFDGRNAPWMFHSSLLLIDDSKYQWLASEEHWEHQFDASGNRRRYTPGLTRDDLAEDVVSEDETSRTSRFDMNLHDLQVDLIQTTPSDGYNFVQSYSFTNPGDDRVSAGVTWFGDLDLGFDRGAQNLETDHVGFVEGPVPRMYFIESDDVSGNDNGTEDRDQRISVAAQLSDGFSFRGFLAVRAADHSAAGGGGLYPYLQDNLGIAEEDLNSFRELDIRESFDDYELVDASVDDDEDGMSDLAGDVAGVMQFSLDLPPGETATLTLDFIGGSLSNAAIRLDENALRGDFNLDGTVDGIDLDRLIAAIKVDSQNDIFDVTMDRVVDVADLVSFVTSVDLLNTYIGDANLDGEFKSSDLVAVFGAGEYEDDFEGNSKWSSGDWNADAEFDSGDLVAAFTDGGYEQGPRHALAVPEPSTLIGLLAIPVLLRRRFAEAMGW